MSRIEEITQRFTSHFEYIGAVPVPMTVEEWQTIDNQDNLRVQLGFRRAEVEDGVARFCPELINATTAHLDDEEFEEYCDTMQWAIDREITLTDLDLQSATEAADSALADLAPGSLRLITSVQMRWLDQQAGAS